MDEITTLLINKCKAYINYMLSQQQWSGLTKAEIERWINNFKGLQPSEILLVYKLITNIIYFSEKDILAVLREGVHKCICCEPILEKQKQADFSLSQHALANVCRSEINKTCFIPLLDNDSPHESGNHVTRMLVQQGIVPASRSMFIDKLVPAFSSGEITKLVIVDDCVGSGDQLRTFWSRTSVLDGTEKITLVELCKKYNITAIYMTLFGYDKSITKLKEDFVDLCIYCIRTLSEEHRVFSDISYIWKDHDERDEALSLFNSISRNCGIPLYGYKNLDFAFIMHQTIPDWSLPLFWREKADWKLLMRRKNSSD